MQEPDPVHGRLQGHSLYGIASLSFVAGRLRTVVEECSQAGRSTDARDKLFLSSVGEFDSRPSRTLRNEMPTLEAAGASLATAVAELSDVLPQLASCDSGSSIPSGLVSDQRSRIKPFDRMQRPRFLTAQGTDGKFANTVAQGAIEEVAAAVGKESGIDFESMGSLMQAARAAILQIRATLK